MLYIHSFYHLLMHLFSRYFVCLLCARDSARLWGYNDREYYGS